MSERVRLPDQETIRRDGYETHWERWATLSDGGERAPIELRDTSDDPSDEFHKRRELPASIVYWTIGLALGALLLGLGTRPGEVVQQPLPSTQIVSANVAVESISAGEEPDDQPAFVIVLDPPGYLARVSARDLEAQLKERLARNGFPNIGVSVSQDDSVFLAGTLFDPSEKREILHLVKSTRGVSAIHFPDAPVRKLYGPAYLGADAAAHQGGGVEVVKVWDGSPAEMAGIRTGDIITSFGDSPVSDADSLRYMVMSHVGGQRVPVSIRRGAEQQTLTVRLGELPALASK